MGRGDDALGDLASFGEGGGPVGGAQVLSELPCDEHLLVRRVGLDRGRESSALLIGEVLGAGAQDGLDPVERVALAAPMAERGLLHAATDLVHDLRVELHDVEGVEHRDRVVELVVDGGLVAGERVERRDLHVATEGVTALDQPARVRLRCPAWHQIQQPRPRLALRVAGQVDHAWQLPRPAPAPVDVVPDVLVDAERGDAVEAGLVRREPLELGLDRPPERLPRGPEPTREPGDRGVLAPQLPDRPGDRSDGHRPARWHQRRDLLDERAAGAGRLHAPPDPLPPEHPHPARAWHVTQHPAATPTTDRHDPARRAAHRPRRRQDGHRQPPLVACSTSTLLKPSSRSQREHGSVAGGTARPVTLSTSRAFDRSAVGATDPRRPRPRGEQHGAVVDDHRRDAFMLPGSRRAGTCRRRGRRRRRWLQYGSGG